MSAVSALALAFVALPVACSSTSGDPDPGGQVIAESEGMISSTSDMKLRIGTGDGRASVTFPKGSAPDGTMVKARLVSGVTKSGRRVVGDRTVQVLPASLVLTSPASLAIDLDAEPAGHTYKGITAKEDAAAWTDAGAVMAVPPAVLDIAADDAGGRATYAVAVSGPGLWGITDPDVAPGDGGGGSGGGDGGGGSGGSGADGGGSDASGGGLSVVRSIAFHELTTSTSMPKGITDLPAISDDGSRIAFAYAPGTETAMDPQRIYVINPDGSGLLQVDSYVSKVFSGAMVAISGDGKTVASSTGYEVRMAGFDGSPKAQVDFGSYETSDIALTGDGKTLFMTQRRDNSLAKGGTMLERGVYTVDAASGAVTKVVTATDVAALVGAMPSDVFPFDTCGRSLAVSKDGSKVAFSALVGGKGPIIGTVSSGTVKIVVGPITGSYPDVISLDLSSDGSTILYDTIVGGMEELGTMRFDGSGKKTVHTGGSGGGCNSPRRLTANGAQLFIGDYGQVYPSAGGDPFYVELTTEGQDIGGAPLGGGGYSGVLSGSGTRFAFVSKDDMGLRQIGFAEIGPSSFGAAPTLGAVTLAPNPLVAAMGRNGVVTAKVSGGGTIKNVGTSWTNMGLEDVGYGAGRVILHDDGKTPDTAAGDGAFTGGGFGPTSDAKAGPRVMRVTAEAKGADGRRHATAVDLSGVEVK